jgi:F-type H+-transporting ATPase subunit delta
MRGNKQIRKTARTLLQLSLKEGEVSGERVQAVLKSLQAHPPRNYRPVLREYLYQVRKHVERSQAIVEYAGPLPANLINEIEASFSARYARPITAIPSENPELIAGVRIRIGSDVYDSSVANHLQELAKASR